jgi:phosphomannomutase/phosphoglucomutase
MAYVRKHVDKSVFRAYDIRGLVDKQLDENVFYSIGKAISIKLKALNRKDVLVARDGRITGTIYSKALVEGLLESGINVIDLGMVPTPVMYYATHTYGVDSGLMVTGSHNPAQYNGLKMVLAGKTLVLEDIEEIYELVNSTASIEGSGDYSKHNILEDYQRRIVSGIKISRPLKAVVDCGNGVAGVIAPRLLRALGIEVIDLYCEVDGNFPNHHPDPTVEENLVDLIGAVQKHNADIGLAFDGDGDRLGVITNKSEIIWPDRLMMMYVPYIISENPGGKIVYDVKCSSNLAKVIIDNGGEARMCPTGHSIVKKIMREENALLAGEMSGHIFFKDRWYGFDDALYSAARLLEILTRNPLDVSSQFLGVPNSVNTPEIKIPIVEDRKFSFMQEFVSKAIFPDANLISIDGLRVEYEDRWGLLRASNTTPCLVARFEAKNLDGMLQIQSKFKAQLQEIDKTLEIPF